MKRILLFLPILILMLLLCACGDKTVLEPVQKPTVAPAEELLPVQTPEPAAESEKQTTVSEEPAEKSYIEYISVQEYFKGLSGLTYGDEITVGGYVSSAVTADGIIRVYIVDNKTETAGKKCSADTTGEEYKKAVNTIVDEDARGISRKLIDACVDIDDAVPYIQPYQFVVVSGRVEYPDDPFTSHIISGCKVLYCGFKPAEQ